MNCLNTVGSGICINGYVPPVTIGGDGTYTRTPSGTTFTSGITYIYAFTGGSNTFISNFTIANMYVIVVGAGGGGAYADGLTGNSHGGGGAGGGSGALRMAYTANATFNIVVPIQTGANADGGDSTFKNSNNVGVKSTGGKGGDPNGYNATAGESFNGFTTYISFTSQTGGYGGSGDGGRYGRNGGNSGNTTTPLITVAGTSYKYGGGGKAGDYLAGGSAGLNGIGATERNGTNSFGQNASSPGSGGGGGSDYNFVNTNCLGSRGEVLIIFTYS